MIKKLIVNNNDYHCMGSVADGVLPSGLDPSVYSIQDYNYDNPDEQVEPIAYDEFETLVYVEMRFIDGQLLCP
jgi:hypothetical protein